MLNDEENAGESGPLARRITAGAVGAHLQLASLAPRIPDPKVQAKTQVNDIVVLLRGLTDIVRRAPGAFTEDDVFKIRAFLEGQVATTGETIARLIGNDPGAADHFSFDMPIAAPQAPRERHPFTGAATPHLASRLPPAAVPAAAVPVGRLVGTNGAEKVYAEPEPPPPARAAPSKNTPDGDVDDGGDGSGTGFLDS